MEDFRSVSFGRPNFQLLLELLYLVVLCVSGVGVLGEVLGEVPGEGLDKVPGEGLGKIPGEGLGEVPGESL